MRVHYFALDNLKYLNSRASRSVGVRYPANVAFTYQKRCASSRALPSRPPGPPKTGKTSDGEDSGDFRPPWVYSATHILTYGLIPTALIYCVLFADWGDREHVFMPLRRWLERQKAEFFSLSADETLLLRDQETASMKPPSVQAEVTKPAS